jgi:pimeloyl-ACP methyl ester carboxylesterase
LGGDKDVNFILAIIDSMANRYDIDRDRVYATGFSMGGMMSWYLSCKIPDKIAAIVPGDGYPLGGMSGCSEVRHVPALQIHGNKDLFVSYSGYVGNFQPSQIARYGCPSTAVKTSPYPVGVNGRNAKQIAAGTRSYWEYYGPCTKNGLTSELNLLTVDGMIHDWATPDKANTNDVDPGYLGLPLDVNGTWEAWNWMRNFSLKGSTPVVTVPAHRDTVFNGGFDQASLGWTLNTWDGTAQGSVANGEYKLEVSVAGETSSGIQLVQNGIILVKGKSYKISFDSYASENRPLEVNVELDVDPWTSYLPSVQKFDLTSAKKSYSLTFTMMNETDSNGRISFNAGLSTGTLFLDNISIQETQTPPVGIKGILDQGMKISSRGIGNSFRLDIHGAQNRDLSIAIFNVFGKPLQTIQLPAKGEQSMTVEKDLSGLPKGVYFIQVLSGKNLVHSTKFIQK